MLRTLWKSLFRRRLGIAVVCLIALSAECGLGQALKQPVVINGGKERIAVHLGRSSVIKSPWPVARVSVTAPKIADVSVLTPTQVLVLGKSVGTTDVILWSKTEQMWQARVDVTADLTQFRADLKAVFPRCRLEAAQSGDAVIVTGDLARAQQAAELRRLLDASGLKYVDMARVVGVQQVQIQVRVAEASRQAIRTLGINAFQTGSDMFAGSTVGSSGGGPINPISIGPPAGTSAAKTHIPFLFSGDVSVSQSVTLFAGFPEWGLQFFLQALAENQYLRVLAEPTLVALSGEEASFLAGGEFPIPVVQDTSTGGGGSISIEYREFGVRLRFRPTVLGDGSIRLFVAPEVSELSDVGAVEISGFRVPAVVTRRAETTLEMKSGQTFGMAGLISRTNSARTSRAPGLGDLPVLGALFRSVRYTSNETELVVLVTASLVEPMSTAQRRPVPGALHTPPDDWELYAEGRIEGKAPARISETDAAWLKQMGLDRLRGPGAWATYEVGPARSRSTARPPQTAPQPEAPAKSQPKQAGSASDK